MKNLIKNIKSNRIHTKIDMLLDSLYCNSIFSDYDDELQIWDEYMKDGEIVFEVAMNLKEIYLEVELLRVFSGFDLNLVKQRIRKKFNYHDYNFRDFNLKTF